MIKLIAIIAAIIVGFYFGLSYLINSPDVDNYIDKHPEYEWAPAMEYYIGQFNIVFGQWDKAIYRFSRVVEKYPTHKYAPIAQYALASAYDQKGSPKIAIIEYQKLIEMYPDSQDEDAAKKRIAVLK